MIVTGIRNARSVGIERYVRHLADGMGRTAVEYRVSDRPGNGPNHWHLANSSRNAILQAARQRSPYVLTIHDVEPRARMLMPAYEAFVYPGVIAGAAKVLVHSSFAADLLRRHVDLHPSRLDVIPHAAPAAALRDRATAREVLGWPAEQLTAVLPGAARAVKLVRETIDAVRDTEWRLVLVGEPRDRRLVRYAADAGATIVSAPEDGVYEAAVAAADVVCVLRRDTVGETNGPLLDALGAGRAVLATRTGSIPEIAGAAAVYCEAETQSIRRALLSLRDEGLRRECEIRADGIAAGLGWDETAEIHRHLFEEVFG
jgi:Glycosyl transferases group 1/Glycosyltransferase Family 4